jgi:hypothetical protein
MLARPSAIGQKQSLIKGFMFRDFWVRFVSDNGLVGATVEVPEEHDQSGLGVELKFLTSEQSIDEATNFWPGLAVAKDGYIPVGSCLCGSGDYYYIRAAEGATGPLYRIYHDAVDEDGYDPDKAIALVLRKYEELLAYVERG